MSTEVDRIRRLVVDGKLSEGEGARLLSAVAPGGASRAWWHILINPFERFGGEKTIFVALVVSALNIAITRLGIAFVDVLNIRQVAPGDVDLAHAVAQQLVVWVLPSLLFWGYARAFGRPARLIDLLGVVGVARALIVPAVFLLLAIHPAIPMGPAPHISARFALYLATTLPFVGWCMTLLVTGFKNASGLTGAKLMLGFIGCLILSQLAPAAIFALSR